METTAIIAATIVVVAFFALGGWIIYLMISRNVDEHEQTITDLVKQNSRQEQKIEELTQQLKEKQKITDLERQLKEEMTKQSIY